MSRGRSATTTIAYLKPTIKLIITSCFNTVDTVNSTNGAPNYAVVIIRFEGIEPSQANYYGSKGGDA
jgi:hypothetical protein